MEAIQETGDEDAEFPELQTVPEVAEAHQDLKQNCQNLHSLVKDVVDRSNFLLLGKFMSRVKQEESKLTDLRQRLVSAQSDIDHNPTVDSVTAQIRQFRTQVEAMSKRADMLETEWKVARDEVDRRSATVQELRQELYTLNRDNMTLSYQIDDQLKLVRPRPPSPMFKLGKSSSDTLSLTPVPDATVVHKDRSKSFAAVPPPLSPERFSDLLRQELFFQQCLRTARHSLLRTEEVPRDSKGMRGSLYFELISTSGKPRSGNGYRSTLMDRDYKNVVYHTVQKMIANARSSIKQRQLAAMEIPVTQLKRYHPMQILGLLCLRNDVVAEMHQKVFPINILRVENALEESTSPLKQRQSSLPPIHATRHLPAELQPNRSRIARELHDKHSISLV